MGKANVVKGKDLMIFLNGKATALATSHALELTAETSEAASKDDGAWSNATVTKKAWTATTEALVSEDPNVDSFDAMYDLFDAGEPVDVISGRPSNVSDDGVPEGGWTVPSQKYYKGKALITSLTRNDPNGDNSSMSISLQGVGKLERIEQ